MRPEHPFIAERVVAHHCKALLGAEPTLADMVPALSLIGERLSRALAPELARVSGGEAPMVSIGMPMDTTLGGIQSELETLAAHSLMVIGPAALPLLMTLEAAPVLRQVDRAFGGHGTAPDPLPDTFPLSAELLMSRIELAVASAVGTAFGGEEAQRVRVRRRETSLRQLDPFPKSEDLLQLAIEIEAPGAEPWSFSLAFPIRTLAGLLKVARKPNPLALRPPPDPEAEPFASVMLEVSALLIDMTLPFSRISGLKPGDILPVAVTRSVPLLAGGRSFATGAIGEFDDRVAVQIANTF